MKKFFRYLKIWLLMSRNSFLSVLYAKLALVIFLSGKIIRFIFFFAFLTFLLMGTKTLAGYSMEASIFFFLTFNLVDVTSQFFFREVYRFRPLVVSGDFDLILVKPVNALFRVLLGGADLIDLITIPPLIYFLIYFGAKLQPNIFLIVSYLMLFFNSLLISAAFHILVLGIGVMTLEIDHTIMIYRDLTALGRFPVDIYREPIRSLITYLLPVGIMMTLPARVLMGLTSVSGLVWSLVFGLTVFILALRFWHFALKHYTSASS